MGTWNRVPVTAVKSSSRSWLPGGSPMNMFSSMRSMTDGLLVQPMKQVPNSPRPGEFGRHVVAQDLPLCAFRVGDVGERDV